MIPSRNIKTIPLLKKKKRIIGSHENIVYKEEYFFLILFPYPFITLHFSEIKMRIQAFCLPVTLDAQPNFNSKSDIITDSFFGQPDIMLVHAKNKGMIMNLRSEMTYGHNVRVYTIA